MPGRPVWEPVEVPSLPPAGAPEGADAPGNRGLGLGEGAPLPVVPL